jgi:soluble lytic murein transglycosylase-like protein
MKIPAWLFIIILLGAATLSLKYCQAQSVPRDALQYQRDLTRNARALWGLTAPVATFAAQIHQESGWRPAARSPYASGLAQFTPATADWISQQYAGELSTNQPLNPSWALRALVTYDRHLWLLIVAVDDCNRMAMTLSAYNGGLGWLLRDISQARLAGADPRKWWNHVERYSRRASWAIAENRGYPRRILLKLERVYAGWGPGVGCPVSS